MRVLVNLDAERTALETRLDSECAALADAIATGDGAAIDTAADAAEATEAELKALASREYQQAKYLERRAAKQRADDAAIELLVERDGLDVETATAQVTGVTVEKQRKRAFLNMVRANGHTVAGFDAAVKSWHSHLLSEQMLDAEAATGGYFFKRQFESRGLHDVMLWCWPVDKVRAYASEELLSWFDTHGRLTPDRVRRDALGLRPTPEPYYHQ